jgi:hypothetical protein
VLKQETDKIVAINEYWGDDGLAPQWRRDKQIGTTIYESVTVDSTDK